jgi:hypothetical protein
MTTQEEIDEMFASLLRNISQICNKTTFVHMSHNIEIIKGEYRNMLQFCKNHPKSLWHSVKDGELPQVNKDYVFSYKGFSYIGYMREDKSLRFNDEYAPMLDINEVDYWMEIPELPTE